MTGIWNYPMKILTWNIMVDDHNPLRYTKIARMLLRADADIICLQEVSVIAWHYIEAEIRRGDIHYRNVYHPLAANSSYRMYGEVILFNSDSVILKDKGYFLLPSRQGRSVQWALFNASGHTFKIATGHLESEQIWVQERQKQWACIMDELGHDSAVPTYWLGDCNMTKKEPFLGKGHLYSYGDTYFAKRFCDGVESHPYDRVWTNTTSRPDLVCCFGYDAESSLDVSDHDGLIIQCVVA